MENKAISVMIGSREYPLKLSTFAVRDIKARFSANNRSTVDKESEKRPDDNDPVSRINDVGEAIDALEDKNTATLDRLCLAVALVSILATHGARAYNFDHPEEPPIPDLPEEVAGSIITIADLTTIVPAIRNAFNEGVGRTVFSMPDDDSEKN